MPRLTKIYTRKGDDGTTSLADGERVHKDSPRVEAYGSVDELNAQIGCVLSMGVGEELEPILRGIQNQLFHLGAELSLPSAGGDTPEGPRIDAEAVDDLEAHIDRMNEGLGPLENFILPGGSSTAAVLQVARAICRRAERRMVTLNREQPLRDTVMRFINRLSDALFVFARYENARRGVDEPLWDSRA